MQHQLQELLAWKKRVKRATFTKYVYGLLRDKVQDGKLVSELFNQKVCRVAFATLLLIGKVQLQKMVRWAKQKLPDPPRDLRHSKAGYFPGLHG